MLNKNEPEISNVEFIWRKKIKGLEIKLCLLVQSTFIRFGDNSGIVGRVQKPQSNIDSLPSAEMYTISMYC